MVDSRAIIQLSGLYAWIVALFLIAFPSLTSIVLLTDNNIVRYVCLALLVCLVICIVIILIVIAKREHNVSPNIPYVGRQLLVQNAMNKQSEATDRWRS